jgi:general secretion pathway protein H
MPISAPANKSCAPDAGFTLIEALMALLIVGLLAGVVALSVPAPDARARAAAQTLAARMMLAGDESVMRNRTIGLRLSEEGYGFASLEADGWRPVEATAPLRYRAWPIGVSGQVLQADGDEAIAARFDVMGGATPIRVRIDSGGGAWLVSLRVDGGVHVERAP